MAEQRKSRETETRQSEERVRSWKRPSLLPTPEPEDGYEFKYIRSSINGVPDNKNVSARLREGWVPVLRKDYLSLMVVEDHDSRFPENIEVGGMLLCKIPVELMDQRRHYQQQKADGQMQAVDNSYLRQSDPRMPMLKPERVSRITRSET